jgi:DNA repair protein RadC
LLVLALFGATPQPDIKPLAKELIAKFYPFAEVVAAPGARLAEVKGIREGAITELNIVHAAASRLARGQVQKRPILSSWFNVIDYCHTAMVYAEKEQFRLLFLVMRDQLIAEELQQTGTVDHTTVYPREVVNRALELSATALNLVHNHPSGDPTPSRADIQMTQVIVDVAKPLGTAMHEHIIVGKEGHVTSRVRSWFDYCLTSVIASALSGTRRQLPPSTSSKRHGVPRAGARSSSSRSSRHCVKLSRAIAGSQPGFSDSAKPSLAGLTENVSVHTAAPRRVIVQSPAT